MYQTHRSAPRASRTNGGIPELHDGSRPLRKHTSRPLKAAVIQPADIADSHRYVPARPPGWNSRGDNAPRAETESSNSRQTTLRGPGPRQWAAGAATK